MYKHTWTLIAATLLHCALAGEHHRADVESKRKDKNNCVVVVMRSNASKADKDDLFNRLAGDEGDDYNDIVSGFHKCFHDPEDIQELLRDYNVEFVQDETTVVADKAGNPASSQILTSGGGMWDIYNLDRIEDPPTFTTAKTIDYVYKYQYDGAGMTTYVVDSGIDATHPEFTGRIDVGMNFSPDRPGTDTTDCNGHGTHTTSTILGNTYGVAKGARVTPVRVWDCAASGFSSSVIAGINWIAAKPPGVVLFAGSINGVDVAVDLAFQRLITLGFHVVVSSGNAGVDACTRSPARVMPLVVGSTDRVDAYLPTNNFGPCVSINAPGSNIVGAALAGGKTLYTGSSMSAALVAGVIVAQLEQYPSVTPAKMSAALLGMADVNMITGLPAGTSNKIVRSQFCIATNGPTCRPVTVSVYTGSMPGQIGWNIWEGCPFSSSNVMFGALTVPYAVYTWSICLEPRPFYTLVTMDSAGDGWGTGWITVLDASRLNVLLPLTFVTGLGGAVQFNMPMQMGAGLKFAAQEDTDAPIAYRVEYNHTDNQRMDLMVSTMDDAGLMAGATPGKQAASSGNGALYGLFALLAMIPIAAGGAFFAFRKHRKDVIEKAVAYDYDHDELTGQRMVA